jgi:hypothetical protein
MRADERETDGWTLAEKAYSAWIRAAREKDTAGAVALARRMAAHLDKAGMLEQVPPVSSSGLSSQEARRWGCRRERAR